jgi:hypothetical protein
MKKANSILGMALGALIISFNACKEDEPTTKIPVTSTTELTSKKVTTAPTMDGIIDASWDACDKLTGTATVSALTDFAFYGNESYDFTMRSMYDPTNLYLLVEYVDSTKSLDRQSWYFDATAKLWKQHNKKPKSATDKYYEDKFAFLWPTASTGAAWKTSTCAYTCHAVDKETYGFDTQWKHFTNSANEVVDMWHWKSVRTGPNNQTDDQKQIYIDPENPLVAGPNGNQKLEGGRSSDDKTAGGYSDNKQTLNNGTADVSVPKYVIPNKIEYYWINQTDIDNGTAKLVTAVDANGVLTFAGGTIDPSLGGYEAGTGTKRFPSIINAGTIAGSRGDITTYANHNGKGWVIEIKRALTTADDVNDVQWNIAQEYMFGFAIFQNAAIAHGIKADLKLKFE